MRKYITEKIKVESDAIDYMVYDVELVTCNVYSGMYHM